MSRRRYALLLLGLGLALALAAVFSLAVGSTDIPARRTLEILTTSGPSLERTIIVDLRLPRIFLAIVVGAGLAGAGTAYQGLFLNPLADPFVIGASSGAALGATASILLNLGALPLAAFLGALGAVGLVYLLGSGGRGGASSPLGLLLAGAAVSTIVGSLSKRRVRFTRNLTLSA